MTLLNRTECSALRGLAIIGIFMHNFIHWLGPMVKENEYTYNQHNVDWLMQVLQKPDKDILWHLFSFFGHYGVPVFVFLSGYGLVLKYEKSAKALSNTPHDYDGQKGISLSLLFAYQFLKKHFMKLFPMMVLGFACFAMIDRITPGHHHWNYIDVIGMLTMTENLFPHFDIWPGPYWFFGLIMQLYLIYILIMYRWRHWGVTAALILACWGIQALCFDNPTGEALNRIRYNCIGNVMPFCLGVLLARLNNDNFATVHSALQRNMIYGFAFIISIILIFTLSLSFHSWLWVPAFIIVFSVALIKLLPLPCIKPLDWVGALSAAIFVCHPITRKIFIPISQSGQMVDGLILYVVSTIVVALLFRMVIGRLRN